MVAGRLPKSLCACEEFAETTVPLGGQGLPLNLARLPQNRKERPCSEGVAPWTLQITGRMRAKSVALDFETQLNSQLINGEMITLSFTDHDRSSCNAVRMHIPVHGPELLLL